jgi:hypothetical protein
MPHSLLIAREAARALVGAALDIWPELIIVGALCAGVLWMAR